MNYENFLEHLKDCAWDLFYAGLIDNDEMLKIRKNYIKLYNKYDEKKLSIINRMEAN